MSTINSYFLTVGWDSMDLYGSSTTASNVYQMNTIVAGSSSYDYLATFHVGNYFNSQTMGYTWIYVFWSLYDIWVPVQVPAGPTMHENYYAWDGAPPGTPAINDASLPSCSKGYFTFIYTCVNGGLYWNNQNGQIVNGNQLYGYYDSQNNTGVVGMPYAWLGQKYLSTNGYASSDNSGYCYIGFQGRDPDLSQQWDLPHTYTPGKPLMSTFVTDFFAYLAMGYTINTSLNYATSLMQNATEPNFGASFLYNGYINTGMTPRVWNAPGQMRVFGDGNMALP